MPRALIIDPDRHSTQTLRTILEEIGMKVDVHNTGAGWLAENLHVGQHDIIFVSLQPDASKSIEVIRNISNHHRFQIILTGSSIDTDIIREASGAGIAYFLGKPFRRHDVIAGIELAIAHAEQVDGYREEVSRLRELLEQRKSIERAKGILMEKKGMGEAEAYRLMQTTAMKRRITLREVAERILRGIIP